MPEVRADVLQAAADAVRAHPWDASRRSEHSAHTYDAGCKVCRGDVEAVLAVAAPILVGQERDG